MFFYTILQGHLLAWVVQHASIIAQKKPVRLFYIPQALQLKTQFIPYCGYPGFWVFKLGLLSISCRGIGSSKCFSCKGWLELKLM